MPGNPDLLHEYVATQRALVAHGPSGGHAPPWPGSSPPSAAAPAAPAPAPAPPARPAGTTRRVTAVRRVVSLDIVAAHYGVDDIDVHSSVSQARTRKRIDAPRPFPPPPTAPEDAEEGMDAKGIFDKARSAPAAAAAAPAVPADLAAIATHEPGIGRHLPKARDRDRDAAAGAASRSRSQSRDHIQDKAKAKEHKIESEGARDDPDEDKADDVVGRARDGGAATRKKDRGRRAQVPRPARRDSNPAPRRVEAPVLFDDGVREDEVMDGIEKDAHGALEPSLTPPPPPPPHAPRRSLRTSSTRSVPAARAKRDDREPAHVGNQRTSTVSDRITRRDVAPVRHTTPPTTAMVDAEVQMSPRPLALDRDGSDDQDHHHVADRLIIAHPPPPSSHAEWPAWMDDADIVDPEVEWPRSAAERTEMSPTAGLIRELEDATRTIAGSKTHFMEMVEDDGAGMEDQPAGPTWDGAAWEGPADDVVNKPSEVDWREPLYLSGLVPRPPPLPSLMTYLHAAPGVLSEYDSSWDVTMGDEVDHKYEWSHLATQSSWAVPYETRRPTRAAWANFPAGPGSPVTEYAGNSRAPPFSQQLPPRTDGWGAYVPARIVASTEGRRALPPSRSDPAAALAFRYRKHRLY
ncbi:hypothetical protein AMAG_16974 [Allomyces macrogynus ATCC 38327]|uniref:Uncharacterized protein n=1 Tax=Allomyces macrogynus (strain ATCC 38327) TaxID=578462 RepID=A0A0L0TE57_ALLM3|nr:hypothetical protein AMAG_16974 [Allomyces macrogynus ATCC 38327]|eukprot:KNE72874.1 hypothetical protein AMAG_16974 [Allomyces macrogynus ATCC 38327]